MKNTKNIMMGILMGGVALSCFSTAEASSNSLVTVTKDQAVCYTNQKLSKKVKLKKGKVYQLVGKKKLKEQSYYLISEGNFKGYILPTQVTTLKAQKENQFVVASKNTTSWKDLNQTNKKLTIKKDSIYKVKYAYRLGNGQVYYSIYQNDAKENMKWKGYIASKDIHLLKKEKVSVEKEYQKATDYPIYIALNTAQCNNDLYGNHKNQTLKKGQTVFVRCIYHVNQQKSYYSVSDGNHWLGYVQGKDLSSEISSKQKKELEKLVHDYQEISSKIPAESLNEKDTKQVVSFVHSTQKVLKDKHASATAGYYWNFTLGNALNQWRLNTSGDENMIQYAKKYVESAPESRKEQVKEAIKKAEVALKQYATVPHYKEYQKAMQALSFQIQ